MDSHIERILSQVPGWNAAEALVTPLPGGITNQNYRVDIGGESFVLRIGGKGTHLLGIDRRRESICTTIAAQMGVGAQVLYFIASQEVLVTRFIEGNAVTPETAARPKILHRIVDAMKRYHTVPVFPGTFCVSVRIYANRSGASCNSVFPNSTLIIKNMPIITSTVFCITSKRRRLKNGCEMWNIHKQETSSCMTRPGLLS